MDEVAASIGSMSEGISKSVSLDAPRRMALKNIHEFVGTFSDQQSFNAAANSSAPPALAQVAEAARIQEAGHLRCRFVFKSCKCICRTKNLISFAAYVVTI